LISIIDDAGSNLDFEEDKLTNWIKRCINEEGYKAGNIEIVLLNNKEITSINSEFLHHPYPTDVISFGEEKKSKIFGTIFIGIETVKENAILHNVSVENEFYRVIIHGILHLVGYSDDTFKKKNRMHFLENRYLLDLLKK
jgi:rRNA maturation RNase YbeY